MPSTTTPPTRWPAASASWTMALIACAVASEDGAAAGGAAEAGVLAVAHATAAWQIRLTRRRRSASARCRRLGVAGRLGLGVGGFGLDVVGGVDIARIPQHPSVRACIAGRLSLLADLVGAHNLPPQAIVV